MFGVSFLEIALVGLVALVVVGPQKLPGMMRTAGEWMGRLRRMTADMRAQTGIDDILREEGIDGVRELRTLLRGERNLHVPQGAHSPYQQYEEEPDLFAEFPVEGADSQGALPDDLVLNDDDNNSSFDDDEDEPFHHEDDDEDEPFHHEDAPPINTSDESQEPLTVSPSPLSAVKKETP